MQAVGIDDPAGYSPDAWAAALAQVTQDRGATAVLAPGTERGSEVLAHVAAILDLPMAANCVAATPGEPFTLTRVRWGGSLLEEARLHGSPLLLTVAPHVHPPAAAGDVETLGAEDDGSPRVVELVQEASTGVSLREAKVVVGGGRAANLAFALVHADADARMDRVARRG